MVKQLARIDGRQSEGVVLLGGVVNQLREVRSAALAMMEGVVIA